MGLGDRYWTSGAAWSSDPREGLTGGQSHREDTAMPKKTTPPRRNKDSSWTLGVLNDLDKERPRDK